MPMVRQVRQACHGPPLPAAKYKTFLTLWETDTYTHRPVTKSNLHVEVGAFAAVTRTRLSWYRP